MNIQVIKRQIEKNLPRIVEEVFVNSSLQYLNPLTDPTLYANIGTVNWQEADSTATVVRGTGYYSEDGLTQTKHTLQTALVNTFATKVEWRLEDLQNPDTAVGISRNQRNAVRVIFGDIVKYALFGDTTYGVTGLTDAGRSNIIDLDASIISATTFNEVEAAIRALISSFQKESLTASTSITLLVSQPLLTKFSILHPQVATPVGSFFSNVNVIYVPELGGAAQTETRALAFNSGDAPFTLRNGGGPLIGDPWRSSGTTFSALYGTTAVLEVTTPKELGVLNP